jgi:membrane-associated phospholipid phosphatase
LDEADGLGARRNHAIIVAVIPAGLRAGQHSNGLTWRMLRASLTRPYPVTWPTVTLLALVPWYIFIGAWAEGRPTHVLALAADRAIPVQPAWALVYGGLYLFLILLPVFVIRDELHIRRLFLAYLSVWITSYIVFLVYPTAASRPEHVSGHGFAAWGLRTLYAADPPYNCFPSLHVAHSFVSAFACSRIHRRVGATAAACAGLVAISTLLTKQHYILDVGAGIALAAAAYFVFLRSTPRQEVTDFDHRVAPALMIAVAVLVLVMIGGYWTVYQIAAA